MREQSPERESDLSKATQQAGAGRQRVWGGGHAFRSWGAQVQTLSQLAQLRDLAQVGPWHILCENGPSGSSHFTGGFQTLCAVKGTLRFQGSSQRSETRGVGAPGASPLHQSSPTRVRRSELRTEKPDPTSPCEGCCAQNVQSTPHISASLSISAKPGRPLSSACWASPPLSRSRVCRPQDHPLTWLAKSRWHTV